MNGETLGCTQNELLRVGRAADQDRLRTGGSGEAQPARGATEPKSEAEFLAAERSLSRGAKDPLKYSSRMVIVAYTPRAFTRAVPVTR